MTRKVVWLALWIVSLVGAPRVSGAESLKIHDAAAQRVCESAQSM
jgi:hypothetical protein